MLHTDAAKTTTYQRADVTLFDRLEIARHFWEPEWAWGEVSRLAEEYDLSRMTICAVAFRPAFYFQARVPGPIEGLESLITGLEMGPLEPEEGHSGRKRKLIGCRGA